VSHLGGRGISTNRPDTLTQTFFTLNLPLAVLRRTIHLREVQLHIYTHPDLESDSALRVTYLARPIRRSRYRVTLLSMRLGTVLPRPGRPNGRSPKS